MQLRFEAARWDTGDERFRARRTDERFELKNAFGHLIHLGATIPVQFIDISLGGCCVRTEKRFEQGSLADVEVVLLLHGMVLRIQGRTQSVYEDCRMGVRFLHSNLRSRNQLAGLLTCLVDESAAEEIQKAVATARYGSTSGPVLASQVPAVAKLLAANPLLKAEKERENLELLLAQAAANLTEESEAETPGPEKAAENLKADEHPGVLRFLKDSSHLSCGIASLQLERCRVRTDQPFTKAIDIRVEVCFQMLGLPFQLAGMTRKIEDPHTVEIQFLEMSRRKGEELAQVIEELQERAGK